MRTLIQGGWVVGYKNPTHMLIRNGVVVFEDDKIIYVGLDFGGRVDRRIDAKGRLVAPGFIDTHVHSGHLAALRMITDVGRPDYFGQPFYEFTAPRQGTVIGEDPQFERADTTASGIKNIWSEFTVVELLRNGTTTFVEFGARAHVQQSLADALAVLGIRGYLGAGFTIGRFAGGEGGKLIRVFDVEHGKKMFDEAVDFVKQIDGQQHGRVRGMLVPMSAHMCSLEQLRNTAVLAREINMPVAVHAAYSVLEFMDILREHQMTPIELLDHVGLLGLGPMLNIGHGNLVAEYRRYPYSGGHDINLMGEHNCSVSHCPVNIVRRARFLDSWKKYQAAGVNMCLGSDTFPRDMLMQMRTASYMGKVMGEDLNSATAAEVFEAATLNGAKSLGRDDIGRLCAGAKADIILVDLTGNGTLRYGPIRDPIKSLVECGIADDIETVIVDGVVRMQDRKIPGVDLERVRTAAQRAGDYMWAHWNDWDPLMRTAEQMNPYSFPVMNR